MAPMNSEATNPFEEGDLFLQQFLPGQNEHTRKLRGIIYRLNIAHKNRRMVPSILIIGPPGTGKGYTANVIAAHLGWLKHTRGRDERSTQTDIYKLASAADMRTQTLTAIPEELAESILFGHVKGAFTGATDTRKGLFDCDEMTDIFIDEIGDATPNVQAKLLEVLETGGFRPLGVGFNQPQLVTEARVIFATNRNLPALVEKDRFREDLLARMMWMPLYLPPLKEQVSELETIIARISEQISARFDIPLLMPSAEEVSWSATYAWPGNHRELQQVIWTWRLFDGARSFRAIVESRTRPTAAEEIETEAKLGGVITDWLCGVRSGVSPGFSSHGSFGDQIKNIGYQALYEFNRTRKLTNDELRKMFTDQDPINVRKQISATRSAI
jgi:transcriptional regulator with AAA-type ATPase domain